MQAKKFNVKFEKPTAISPSYIYVSPSEHYTGHYNVGILYVKSSNGSFKSTQASERNFDLKQNLVKTEQEAFDWAVEWLTKESKTVVVIEQE